MKIFTLGENAVRPRILLIDFKKAEAQALRDSGYKVYLGSSGFEDGLFNIPIESHRVDIVIYKAAYNQVIPKAGEEIRLGSITQYKGFEYKHKTETGEKIGKVWFTFPELAATTKLNYKKDIFTLRENVLNKCGTILVFLGDRRIEEDEYFSKILLSIDQDASSIKKTGGPEKEYELLFKCDNTLNDLGKYFKSLIIGESGHHVDYLRGFSYSTLPSLKEDSSDCEFCAYDENENVYAFIRKMESRGILMFMPDYGPTNIEIAKFILSQLSSLSPKELFNRDYQEEAWLEDEQYKFSDELDILKEKDKLKNSFEEGLNCVEEKRKGVRSKTDYFRAILKNGDDDKTEEQEQLKPPLKKVLEWLGIEVTDLDKILKQKDEALMNDFILKADGKEILCEAKGVTTGPRGEYVTQIQKHIIRFSKLMNQPALPGILILNYQRDLHPNKRSEFYTDAAIIKEAKESDIGLLDTRELFNICKTIYSFGANSEAKKKARQLIFSTGVIVSKDLNK